MPLFLIFRDVQKCRNAIPVDPVKLHPELNVVGIFHDNGFRDIQRCFMIHSKRNLCICRMASQKGPDAEEDGDGGFHGNRDLHAASFKNGKRVV